MIASAPSSPTIDLAAACARAHAGPAHPNSDVPAFVMQSGRLRPSSSEKLSVTQPCASSG